MRFISTKMHAVMDYVMGILLIVAPLLWRDTEGVPEAAIWTPVAVGVLMLLQSLITDYELSLANIIPMSGHLTIDALAGILLAASPWLFGFADTIWWPHVLLGLGEIGAAMTTQTRRGEPARPVTGAHVHT